MTAGVSLTTLPPDTKFGIFEYLTITDLGRLSQVCQSLGEYINNACAESLWKVFCARDFCVIKIDPTQSAQQMYKALRCSLSLEGSNPMVHRAVQTILEQNSPEVWENYQRKIQDLVLHDFYVIDLSLIRCFARWNDPLYKNRMLHGSTLSRLDSIFNHLGPWLSFNSDLTLHKIIWFFEKNGHFFTVTTENNLNQLAKKAHELVLNEQTHTSRVLKINALERAVQHKIEEWVPEKKEELRKEELEKEDLFQNTVLHCACFGGHVDITRRLLEAGANIRNTNVHSDYPLLEEDNVELFKLLIEKYEHIDLAMQSRACERGFKKIMEYLIEKRSSCTYGIARLRDIILDDRPIREDDYISLLEIAILKEHKEVADLLAQKGTVFDCALFADACRKQDYEVIDFYLKSKIIDDYLYLSVRNSIFNFKAHFYIAKKLWQKPQKLEHIKFYIRFALYTIVIPIFMTAYIIFAVSVCARALFLYRNEIYQALKNIVKRVRR